MGTPVQSKSDQHNQTPLQSKSDHQQIQYPTSWAWVNQQANCCHIGKFSSVTKSKDLDKLSTNHCGLDFLVLLYTLQAITSVERCQRVNLSNNKMMLLVLAFLPLIMSRPVLEELVRSNLEETLEGVADNLEEDLCPNGSSYCEQVENYPYKAILAAMRNQSELVNTPGLWDPPIKEDLEDLELDLEEYDGNKEEFELYHNGIVPY